MTETTLPTERLGLLSGANKGLGIEVASGLARAGHHVPLAAEIADIAHKPPPNCHRECQWSQEHIPMRPDRPAPKAEAIPSVGARRAASTIVSQFEISEHNQRRTYGHH